ncbi:MAG: hypothetical protein AB3X44_13800 [Leptothrix sp. (in: b-proteobacteria)]
MSGASTPADPPTRLLGRVERRLLGQGTKSEHVGVVLVTADGQVWKLRRIGGNPFRDPVLDALEGERVEIDGRAEGSGFFFESWRVI